MFNDKEHFFQCPKCFQAISMVVEVLYGGQEYIEDCEVCCQPILIKKHQMKMKSLHFLLRN